jgi:hypothetical protein
VGPGIQRPEIREAGREIRMDQLKHVLWLEQVA